MAGYGVALVACLAALVHLSAAAKYTVGDSTGWTVPATTSFYSSWAAKQTYKVGDVLEFNFPSGAHTVAEVSKSAYDACTTTNTITTYTTGPASVNISTAGAHYYICTIPTHCSGGQKLAITAAAAAAASPKSSPAPASSKTPASAPSASPATAPAPSSLSPATAPSPSSGSPVTASSPAPTPASTPTSAPSPAPSSAATPTSAPVPAPSSGGSSPATSPASSATSPGSSTTTTPSAEASLAGGPSSTTTPSSPSSGATAAAGSVLSILLIGAAFLF